MIANCLRTVTHMHLCTHGGMAMSIRERVAAGTLRASAHARVRPSKYDCACRIRTRPCMRSRAPLQACLRAYVHARAHVSAYGGYRRALVFFSYVCMYVCTRTYTRARMQARVFVYRSVVYLCLGVRARPQAHIRARSLVCARARQRVGISVQVRPCARARP